MREERMAKNESLFRSINNNVKGAAARGGSDVNESLTFLCECWVLDCDEMLTLTGDQYVAVRAHPDRFFVAPGHEAPDVEQVVHDAGSFRIVEKLGRGRDVAIDMARMDDVSR